MDKATEENKKQVNVPIVLSIILQRQWKGKKEMSIADIIQSIGILVLLLTLIAMLYQIFLQNRLTKAQLLRDRFEMYWRTYEPISQEHVMDFEL
jgi:hypothetical protein